jgi:hypothetical protein
LSLVCSKSKCGNVLGIFSETDRHPELTFCNYHS